MTLMLNIHESRVPDIILHDHMRTDPAVPLAVYRDNFGNLCSRLVAVSTENLIRSGAGSRIGLSNA